MKKSQEQLKAEQILEQHNLVDVVPITKTPEETAIINFRKQLKIYEAEILPRLLSNHGISPEQFAQTVISEVKKSDKLLKAFMENPPSMYASILFAAEIGLIPSSDIGEFFLIAKNLKQPNGTYKNTVTPQIGYKGIVNILLRSGDVTKVHTEVVYDGDLFEPTYGLEPTLVHVPNFDNPRLAANIKFAYAVAKKKNGEYQFEILTRNEIEAIKGMSKYENELYFNDKKDPKRWMLRKAALIQLSKMLDKDYHSKKAIQIHQILEGGGYLSIDKDNNVKTIENSTINHKIKGMSNVLQNLSDKD